jgi:capsular exopolysaccharide synthesis family protein
MESPSTKTIETVTYVLFRRKWMIVSSFTVMFVTMLFFIWLITPTYKATNKVLVHNNYKQQLSIFNDLASPGLVNPRVNWTNNLVEIAKNVEIAEKIVKRFGLDKRHQQKVESPQTPREIIKSWIGQAIQWPFVQLEKRGLVKRKPPDYLAKAVEEFLEDMEDVKLVEDTAIIDISVHGESPRLANEIVEALTQVLIEKMISIDREEAGATHDYVLEQIGPAEKAYIESTKGLETYKLRWQVTSFDDEKKLKLEHLETLQLELSKTLADLAEKKAGLSNAQNQLDSYKIVPSEYRDISNHLVRLEMERAAIDGRKHQLEKDIEKLEQEITDLINRENEYLRLEKQVALDEELYLKLVSRKNELFVQKGTEVGEFSIKVVDSFRVSPNARPGRPPLGMLLPIILIFSLGTAIMGTLLVEFFSDYPRNPSELEETAGIPVWGIITRRRSVLRLPIVKFLVSIKKHYPVLKGKSAKLFNDYNSLGTRVILNTGNRNSWTLLMTSARAGEGKTYTTINLACNLALRQKRVLMIDGNPWNPTLTRRFDLREKQGFFDCLRDTKISSCAEPLPDFPALYVIGTGQAEADLVQLLQASFGEFVSSAKREYDIVLFDSAPINSYHEGRIIASNVDSVFLVVRAHRTTTREIILANELIGENNSRLDGIVMNRYHDYIPKAIRGLF